jgi:hypothetical protein
MLKWHNDVDWRKAVEAWADRADQATNTAIVEATALVSTEVAASFGVGSGPVSRTGRLASSVTSVIDKGGLGQYTAQVGPAGLEYVRRVELGKAGRHSAGPHPYFTPGWDRAAIKFVEVFARAWVDTSPTSGKG